MTSDLEFELEGELEGALEGESEYEFETEFEWEQPLAELEGEYELEGEGEFELEGEYESEFEDEYELEGEEFIGGLARGLRRRLRTAFPLLKRIARIAAPLVGTAVGGPLGGVVGGAVGTALREGEWEYEDEFEAEYESDHEDELEYEDEFEVPLGPITHTQALGELMAAQAASTRSEAEAEAMIGAAAIISLTPVERAELDRLLPNLVRGVAVLTRILRSRQATRPVVRAVPTIVNRTTKILVRRRQAGQPINGRIAGKVMANQTRRVLGDPRASTQAVGRNLKAVRAVKTPSPVRRVPRAPARRVVRLPR